MRETAQNHARIAGRRIHEHRIKPQQRAKSQPVLPTYSIPSPGLAGLDFRRLMVRNSSGGRA